MSNTPKPQANKTIDEILADFSRNLHEYANGRGTGLEFRVESDRAKQAITQHLLDVIERAKPEKLTLNPKTYDRNEYEMRAYNQAIDQFHQNIIKELKK